MDDVTLFEKHGLFSARVPRYTSYPPANRFLDEVGLRRQSDWLGAVGADLSISLYIHIPFCKRLCWFCACRTQGTSSGRPVENYVTHLLNELRTVRDLLPSGVSMSRLHLGGGTPTTLAPGTMDRLLTAIFDAFRTTPEFEFSVEVDPTDAAPALLDTLVQGGLHRASIGVQDFDPKVQKAIGRDQSVDQTRAVVDHLRAGGVTSTNFDLLYGLPHQTRASLSRTIDSVLDLAPDRLALYGYAHVPWMSKRQVMIDGDMLPDARERLLMAEFAAERFVAAGYDTLGIDHFALPNDGLARAARDRTLSRNFQGYTDDTSPVLIGLGASAISKFPQGFVQNAVSTSAYLQRAEAGMPTGFKGYALTDQDRTIAWMVEQLMCFGSIPLDQAPNDPLVDDLAADIMARFGDVLQREGDLITLPTPLMPLARVIAAAMDDYRPAEARHSLAI